MLALWGWSFVDSPQLMKLFGVAGSSTYIWLQLFLPVINRVSAFSRFLIFWIWLFVRFGVDALSVMQLMVQAQANGLDDDDPTRVYMLRAWVGIW